MSTATIPDTLHICPGCCIRIASGLNANGDPKLCDSCERSVLILRHMGMRPARHSSGRRRFALSMLLGMFVGVALIGFWFGWAVLQ